MERRTWLALIASCLLVASFAFELGRWSRSAVRRAYVQASGVGAENAATARPVATPEATDFAGVAIENLTDVDFDHAFELLRAAPREALASWAKRLEALPVGSRRTGAIKVFFKTLAQVDAAAAADLALTLERNDPRWTATSAVVAATPVANLREVARMFTALNEKKLSAGELIHEWSRVEPLAVADFVASYAGGVDNNEVGSFLANWAALDPAAAALWLAQTDASRRVPAVYARFYSGWAEHDQAAAFADLAARGADETFREAIKTVTEELFLKAPDAAEVFVRTLTAKAAQQAAVDSIAGYFDTVYLGYDPLNFQADQVARWLVALPDTLWRDQIGSVAKSWVRADRAAFDAWLGALPTRTRDLVLADYLDAFDWDDPTVGVRVGLSINDPETRDNAFREVFAEMTPERRDKILEKVELSPAEAREVGAILKRL